MFPFRSRAVISTRNFRNDNGMMHLFHNTMAMTNRNQRGKFSRLVTHRLPVTWKLPTASMEMSAKTTTQRISQWTDTIKPSMG